MKIGVLGGTFDPVHNGHLALAHAAIKSLALDEVLFVPAKRNPLKDNGPSASGADRLQMICNAIADEPRFAATDIELRRQGPSYMVDTLFELAAARPADYWLLLGMDAALTLPNWRNYQKLLKLARIGCAERGGGGWDLDYARLADDVRERVDRIDMPRDETSATDIRTRLYERKPMKSLVPPAVLAYIDEKRLYR